MKNLVTLTLGFTIARAAAPAPTPAPDVKDAVARRADTTCTFSGSDGYSSASASKAACSTIVLSALTVPGGETLDLEDLNDGTTVSQTPTFMMYNSLTIDRLSLKEPPPLGTVSGLGPSSQ